MLAYTREYGHSGASYAQRLQVFGLIARVQQVQLWSVKRQWPKSEHKSVVTCTGEMCDCVDYF